MVFHIDAYLAGRERHQTEIAGVRQAEANVGPDADHMRSTSGAAFDDQFSRGASD